MRVQILHVFSRVVKGWSGSVLIVLERGQQISKRLSGQSRWSLVLHFVLIVVLDDLVGRRGCFQVVLLGGLTPLAQIDVYVQGDRRFFARFLILGQCFYWLGLEKTVRFVHRSFPFAKSQVIN